MKNFTQSLLALWKQLGLNQRVSLVVAALAVVGGLVGVVLWSQRPDYQLLYSGLGGKDAAAVISYLESQNVPHEVTAGGTAVQVPASMVYRLRMELAGKGLPSGEGVGFEIFDKGQFGLSDFVQRTNYLRAVQGELARTIMQLRGVRAARVMVVEPQNRLLLTDQGVKPTASVFVDVGGGELSLEQVNAIRQLVANSVQGLTPDGVAVVDNQGRTLSDQLKTDPALGTASSQIRYREQVEDYFARKVESMLAAVLGPGNAVVRVSADIDPDATTETSEKFDPQSQVVRSQTDTEDTTNTSETRSRAGAVGVSANVPGKTAADQPAGPASNSEQTRKDRTTTYEIDRTTTSTTRTAGAVKSLTAAVFIAPREAPAAGGASAAPGKVQKRTPEELEAIRQLVANALGVTPTAGRPLDSIVSVQETAFASPIPAELQAGTAVTAGGTTDKWLDRARGWAPLAGALVVLLLFWRLLTRQKPEPIPLEVLSLAPEPSAAPRTAANGITPELLNDLIRQKPANVGMALRNWSATQPVPAKN